MNQDSYQIFFTDDSLQPIGQMLAVWTELDIIQREDQQDTYSLTAPATAELVAICQPPNRIVILRDVGAGPVYFASGPIEAPADFDWSVQSGATADPGQVVAQFTDDGLQTAGRITYPDTSHDFEHQTATGRNAITSAVPAETAIKDLVNRNAGPGAHNGGTAYTDRRVPNLTIEALHGSPLGANVTYSTRFDRLTDVLRTLALAGGVHFRTVQVPGPALEFQVYAGTDRSASIVYSRALGNLQTLSLRSTAPATTVACVGGDGTGTSRTTVEVAGHAAYDKWGRFETFVSSTSTDVPTLTIAGQQQLVQDGEQGQLSAGAVDSARIVYGRDYFLSDLVSVEDGAGRSYVDRVTSVAIKVDSTGEVTTPTIGSGSATADSAIVKQIQYLRRDIGQLGAS